MPLNYNVKRTDTGTGWGYNTTVPIKPPKKKNPKPLNLPQVTVPTAPAPAPVVNRVAKVNPAVQSFINLMRGTALSMPTFDPYETPASGDPYDHGAYVGTTAPNVGTTAPNANPYQADLDWAMAKRQKNSPTGS